MGRPMVGVVLRGARSRPLFWTLVLMLAAFGAEALYAEIDPQRSVTTVRYNNARTGWNANETALTIDNVRPATFGKKWSVPLDGYLYAAPLYVHGVVIGGRPRNAVFVATEKNWIYALDAETRELLWPPYRLGPPGLQSLILDPVNCGSILPDIGITSTPVIDLETNTLYAVGLTLQPDNTQLFKMAAVDITTGQSRPGWPIVIDPLTTPRLDTRITSNRGALTLVNDRVYVPFGAYSGDCGSYHGWVVGVNKRFPTLPQIYYRTPSEDRLYGSGIWASSGVAADANGNLYPVTGNSFKAQSLDYSNTVLRLPSSSLAFSRDPADFFTPSNWVDLNDNDDDLGASGAMLLPPQEGSTTPNMIFVAGKRGVGHLINRDNLGGVARGDGIIGEGLFSRKVFFSAFSTAAYYEDPVQGPIIFLAGWKEQPNCPNAFGGVVALGLDLNPDRSSSYHPLWCTEPRMDTSLSPVVTSAEGQTGILWVVDHEAGILYAFNAFSGEPLYNSSMVPGDELVSVAPFQHFIVVEGRVFVATLDNTLVSYGLR